MGRCPSKPESVKTEEKRLSLFFSGFLNKIQYLLNRAESIDFTLNKIHNSTNITQKTLKLNSYLFQKCADCGTVDT